MHNTLQRILITAMASIALAACSISVTDANDDGATPRADRATPGGASHLDTNGYEPLPCGELKRSDLSPPAPIDYLEILVRDPLAFVPDAQWETTHKDGTPCATATDKPACEAAIAAAYQGRGIASFGSCGISCGEVAFLLNRGDDVRVLGTVEEVKAEMLGTIDTPQEAVLTAKMARYDVACGESVNGGARVAEDGYELIATSKDGDCVGLTLELRHRLSVGSDGALQDLESELIRSYDAICE